MIRAVGRGITSAEESEMRPGPAAFLARTVKLWTDPLVSPGTVHDKAPLVKHPALPEELKTS